MTKIINLKITNIYSNFIPHYVMESTDNLHDTGVCQCLPLHAFCKVQFPLFACPLPKSVKITQAYLQPHNTHCK